MINWLVLIIGLLAIALFWHVLSTPERKRETHIVSAVFIVLGIVVYYVQSVIIYG